jgi:hypothetical protein
MGALSGAQYVYRREAGGIMRLDMARRSFQDDPAHAKLTAPARRRPLFGFAIIVAAAASASIATAADRRYLGSDIPVVSVTVGWDGYLVDRNWAGPGFHIGGVFYSKGIFVHAPSVATFDLGGRFTNFSGCVGQDDADGDCGNGSRISVYGDGVLLWARDIGNGPVVCTELNVAGVRTLRLEADPKGPITCDEVEWVNPVVY